MYTSTVCIHTIYRYIQRGENNGPSGGEEDSNVAVVIRVEQPP